MRELLGKLRSTRVRALLALGVFFVFASVGTLAFWTAGSNVPGASFQTGSFDLKINDVDNLTWTGLNEARLAPGESIAFQVTLRNAGTPGLTWTARGSATGQLAGELRYQMYVGGVATNTARTSSTAVDRSGACGGTTAQATPVALGSADTSLVSAAQPLAKGATASVCVRISLPAAAESQQGQSATPVFTFDAKQVAP